MVKGTKSSLSITLVPVILINSAGFNLTELQIVEGKQKKIAIQIDCRYIYRYLWTTSFCQGYNAKKVNCSCGCGYFAYIFKPVLSGRNL